jgi:hypothetical protein
MKSDLVKVEVQQSRDLKAKATALIGSQYFRIVRRLPLLSAVRVRRRIPNNGRPFAGPTAVLPYREFHWGEDANHVSGGSIWQS